MEKKEEKTKKIHHSSSPTQPGSLTSPTTRHHQGQVIKFSESSALNIQGQI